MRARCLLANLVANLLVVTAVVGMTGAADAKPRTRRAAKGTAAKSAPAIKRAPKADTRAVSELMGPFKWGMSKEEVLHVLDDQIDKSHVDEIKATSDAYEQDRIRKRAAEEKKRIAASWIEFTGGAKTGWDVSIVDKEYGHKNEEAMLVHWENDPQTNKDQRRFFFFVEGKLWKMFIALNAELFQGKSFADFAQAVEARYGKGESAVTDDGVHELVWRSAGYYLRAIDLTKFYGNYCIAISDEGVEGWIYRRREERDPRPIKVNPIMDSVGQKEKDDSKPPLDDPNADVIDRMTGPNK